MGATASLHAVHQLHRLLQSLQKMLQTSCMLGNGLMVQSLAWQVCCCCLNISHRISHKWLCLVFYDLSCCIEPSLDCFVQCSNVACVFGVPSNWVLCISAMRLHVPVLKCWYCSCNQKHHTVSSMRSFWHVRHPLCKYCDDVRQWWEGSHWPGWFRIIWS